MNSIHTDWTHSYRGPSLLQVREGHQGVIHCLQSSVCPPQVAAGHHQSHTCLQTVQEAGPRLRHLVQVRAIHQLSQFFLHLFRFRSRLILIPYSLNVCVAFFRIYFGEVQLNGLGEGNSAFTLWIHMCEWMGVLKSIKKHF